MKLEVSHLTKTLGGVTILDDVNMRLQGGMVIGLEGANGSGKTMLLRAMAGLIRPSKGYVSVDGKVLWRDIPFPKSAGILIENPAFLESRTGLANLMILGGMRATKTRGKGLSASELRASAKAALAEVGLDPCDKRKFKKYSLGMKQRLGIAAAMMDRPDLVLLDEPTNALDPSGVELLKGLVRSACDKGSLVIVASHDASFLREVADEVYYMAEGRAELSVDKAGEER